MRGIPTKIGHFKNNGTFYNLTFSNQISVFEFACGIYNIFGKSKNFQGELI